MNWFEALFSGQSDAAKGHGPQNATGWNSAAREAYDAEYHRQQQKQNNGW